MNGNSLWILDSILLYDVACAIFCSSTWHGTFYHTVVFLKKKQQQTNKTGGSTLKFVQSFHFPSIKYLFQSQSYVRRQRFHQIMYCFLLPPPGVWPQSVLHVESRSYCTWKTGRALLLLSRHQAPRSLFPAFHWHG